MKLSIITINYNNVIGLERTIKSVTAHNQADFEYIVIDGGSSDGSIDVIEEYKEKIDYWESKSDRGIYHAMNKGIRAAKGEYLLFMNSGDEINPSSNFQDIIKVLDTGEDILIFNIEVRGTNSSYIRTYPDKIDFLYLLYCSISHQGTFIKRIKLLEYGGYNEKMKITADWAYFLDAICFLGHSYRYEPQYFAIYYLDGISSSPENARLMMQEQRKHVADHYPHLSSIFQAIDELETKKNIIDRLRKSRSIRVLKKLGFIKWFI